MATVLAATLQAAFPGLLVTPLRKDGALLHRRPRRAARCQQLVRAHWHAPA
jgi:hypothetical protein